MNVAKATEPPRCIVNPASYDPLGTSEDTTGDVNALPLYEATPSHESQIECHKQDIIRDDEMTTRDWLDDMKIDDEYGSYGRLFIKMMLVFLSMRDGHLERINAAKHKIE